MLGRLTAAIALTLVGVACTGEDEARSSTTESTMTAVSAPTSSSLPTPSSTTVESATSPPTTTAEPTVHDPDDVPIPEGAVIPSGFDRVQATVITADGLRCTLCLWLADDGDRRTQGLKFVDDIGPADGMAFVYPAPDTRTFTMNQVRIDLDIAFFDADRRYMAEFPMTACPLGGCEGYPTPDGITVALEVRPGSLPDLGVAPGSTLELTDRPCG